MEGARLVLMNRHRPDARGQPLGRLPDYPRRAEPQAGGPHIAGWLLNSAATRETDPSRAACNSIQNADAPLASTRLVRVTHPFHPFSGQKLACLGERYNRYGRRLLLQIDDHSICSVPPQWTDLVAQDPEIIMGGRRALFRMADLVELARLVERLGRRDPLETSYGA
ncbi:MAG: hypothetical protein DRH50_14110 [Deltaproteobacteria bacterium]|nr:MAG: hypothetical protein DRH50_14110 [Deltaproteobacteria bacterium]